MANENDRNETDKSQGSNDTNIRQMERGPREAANSRKRTSQQSSDPGSRTADNLTSSPHTEPSANHADTNTHTSNAPQHFTSPRKSISPERSNGRSAANPPSKSRSTIGEEQPAGQGSTNCERTNHELRQGNEMAISETAGHEKNEPTNVQMTESNMKKSTVGWLLSIVVAVLSVGGAVVYLATKWSESIVPAALEPVFSPPSTSPLRTPNPLSPSSSTSPPSSLPTLAFRFDPPLPADCDRVRNGEPVLRQDLLTKRSFDVILNVTMGVQVSQTETIDLLELGIQKYFIPKLVGCQAQNRKLRHNRMLRNPNRFVVGNGEMHWSPSSLQESPECSFSICLSATFTLDLFLKRDEEQSFVIENLVTDILGDDLVDSLQLESSIFQSVAVRSIISKEASMVPSSHSSLISSTPPSQKPIGIPSNVPTFSPNAATTQEMAIPPTLGPTLFPTLPSSIAPTPSPITTSPALELKIDPTPNPAPRTSTGPTLPPTQSPNLRFKSPSFEPTSNPTDRPTPVPTPTPTDRPTPVPTLTPSVPPTSSPTITPQPTLDPSPTPTNRPSSGPSLSPSESPSLHPTTQPSMSPSSQPTDTPSVRPSTGPSVAPTPSPTTTVQPSKDPTPTPTLRPSSTPTFRPSESPSFRPTTQPSISPSFRPTSAPSARPTRGPTLTPSVAPTSNPTTSPPTRTPSLGPTPAPTTQPSSKPTLQPSQSPSRRPTNQPSISPSSQPTITPAPTVTPPLRVACVGDSLTRGSYPSQLQQMLGEKFEVHNFGRNAMTAIRGMGVSYVDKWQFRASLRVEPDIYLLMLGTNDARYWETQGHKYQGDMEWIVNKVLSIPLESPPRIILAVPPWVKKDGAFGIRNHVLVNGVQPALQNLAAKKDLQLVNMYDVTYNQAGMFTGDGLHLNHMGYGSLATAWKTAIECNQNGICEAGEDCTTCPEDCHLDC